MQYICIVMDKNQFKRYQEYDSIFRDFNQEWTKEEIITHLGISERTFNLDRRAMESIFNIEIVSTKGTTKNNIYRYEDRDMSINERALSQDQVDRIEQAVSILSGISGLDLFDGFEDIFLNLRGYSNKRRITEEMTPFLSFQTDTYHNTKNFEFIFNAIRDRTVLNVKYKDYKEHIYEFEIHPYFLKYYNEMWYLLGYNSENNLYDWVVPLDRIENVEHINKAFKINNKYRFDLTYFDDVVGVTKFKEKEPVEIKLKVNPESIEFIERKPLNNKQKPIKKENDGNYYTYITVRPNNELYNRILMFGDNVEIVEPLEIRKEIGQKIHNMFVKYQNS